MYIKANSLFILRGIEISNSVMLGEFEEGDFKRLYFHDHKPGNFVLIVIKKLMPNLSHVFELNYCINEKQASTSIVCHTKDQLVNCFQTEMKKIIDMGLGK